jgi:hypothetical protein
MSAVRVPVPTLVHVYLRSLFLQAGWNPEGMQNLGFCYAITPALDALSSATLSSSTAIRISPPPSSARPSSRRPASRAVNSRPRRPRR